MVSGSGLCQQEKHLTHVLLALCGAERGCLRPTTWVLKHEDKGAQRLCLCRSVFPGSCL